MDNFTKKHLQDILTAIEEIDSFLGDTPKLFDSFVNNICLRRAVVKNIEIIGESMNRILKTDPGIKITNARDILWSIVINHLPLLKEEVTLLMKND